MIMKNRQEAIRIENDIRLGTIKNQLLDNQICEYLVQLKWKPSIKAE